MNKKKLFGIVLFIIIGLFTFTFANPNEKVEEKGEGNLDRTELPIVDDTKTEDNQTTENSQTTDMTPQVNNPNITNNQQLMVDNSLSSLKQSAIDEVKNYQKNKNLTENEAAKKLVEKTTNSINEATSEKEIKDIVENTKNELDKIKDELDLEQYKELAKQELKRYSDSKNFNKKYQLLADELLNQAYEKIDSAKSKNDIDIIVKITKKALDNLKNEENLESLRNKAIEEIKDYKKDEVYSEENQNKIDDIKNKTINDINKTSKDEIEKIVEEAKKEIDSILTLNETKFNVKFINLNGEIVKEEDVLYGKSAIAPDMNDIEINGITYSFTSWNQDYKNITSNLEIKANYVITKVMANIYGIDLIGSIELNINDEIINAITNNVNAIITTEENQIILFSKNELPVLNKLNYKYNYYQLSYSTDNGFRIDAKEVLDEEELNRNTVTITYKINSELAVFLDGTKQQQSTTYTGNNTVVLPDVYLNNNKIAVVWTDENGNVISKIEENSIKLINELNYNKSVVLTANIDTTAPIISLIGDSEIEVNLSLNEDYIEEGYTAIDNYNGDITSLVTTSITLNGMPTNQVNYSVAGIYVITYSVVDTEGNVATAKRTITVVDPITEVKTYVFALNDGVERPDENKKLGAQYYNKIGEVNLVVDKVRSYIGGITTVVATSDIESYILGGKDSLPKTNEKYYSYECYILKHESDGFHLDCEKVFDADAYKKDKLNELNDLLNKDYTIYEETKTSGSYKDLIDTVNDIKNSMPTTIEEIEKDIERINKALESLVDLVLVNISLSSNNDTYNLNSNMKTITVTAIYNDTTRNKVLNSNEYSVNTKFDSKTVGTKAIVYTYQNKQAAYTYKVEYSQKQLQEKVNSVEATLKEKISLSKTEYKIIFSNLSSDVNIKNINVTKNNKVLNTIKLNKISHDTYSMNRSDYFTLVNNNTTIANKKINITYQVGNQEITVSYYESFNKLHKCK